MIVFLFCISVQGTDFYHNTTIESSQSYDLVSVYDSPPQQTTIQFYGYSDELVTHNSSVVNIYSGGTVSDFFQINPPVYSKLYDSSTVNVYAGGGFSGGTAGCLDLYDTSVLNVNGGTVWEFTCLNNHSTVNVNDGGVLDLWYYDYGVLNLYKGTIDTFLENDIIPATAAVNIYGYGFNYTPNGRWEPIGDGHWTSKLTGYSSDGGSILYWGLPDPATNTNIHLIPEPATLLLLGLGGVMLRKRRA